MKKAIIILSLLTMAWGAWRYVPVTIMDGNGLTSNVIMRVYATKVSCAVLHLDANGEPIPCPGYEL